MLESEWRDYEFKLCTSSAELCAAYNLRMEVFHEEQKFPKETEVDSYDPLSAHFIVISKKDNNVVATVRLFPYPSLPLASTSDNSASNAELERQSCPLGAIRSETEIVNEFHRALAPSVVGDGRGVKLSRMAVKKRMRGKGIGAMTLREAEQWLLKTLCANENLEEFSVVLSSQMQAKRFYEKSGYVSQGEPYDEEGMLHVRVRKQLKKLNSSNSNSKETNKF